MGTDKASLPYGGMTLLRHMLELAVRAGAAPVLVAGGAGGDIPDPVAGAGPVAGLQALLRAEETPRRWVVMPVDMPLLHEGMLLRLAAACSRAAYFEGHPLPFGVAIDSTTHLVLEHAGRRLAAGENMSVRDVLGALEAEALFPDHDERRRLVNANTPEEWERITGTDEDR